MTKLNFTEIYEAASLGELDIDKIEQEFAEAQAEGPTRGLRWTAWYKQEETRAILDYLDALGQVAEAQLCHTEISLNEEKVRRAIVTKQVLHCLRKYINKRREGK